MSQKSDLRKALDELDEIGVICTDGSSAADIIANGQAPTPKVKPEPKPA